MKTRTEKDLVEMVAKYRAEYPWLKTVLTEETLKGLRHLEENFGLTAIDEFYEVVETQIIVEIKTKALVELGIPFDEAYNKIWKEMSQF